MSPHIRNTSSHYENLQFTYRTNIDFLGNKMRYTCQIHPAQETVNQILAQLKGLAVVKTGPHPHCDRPKFKQEKPQSQTE